MMVGDGLLVRVGMGVVSVSFGGVVSISNGVRMNCPVFPALSWVLIWQLL